MAKKITAILLSLVLVFMFCGCGTSTGEAQNSNQKVEEIKEEKGGIRQELKDFLKSYEACMDEYVEFMKSYNPSDLSLLTKYTDFLKKYTDFAEKAQAWENKDLNNEELLYYTEVLERVSQKLLKVSLGK